MILLLFVVILSEMLMILAFLFNTPSRKLVILGLDQIKRLSRPRRGEARVRAAREAQSKGGAQAQAFTNQGGCNKLREPRSKSKRVAHSIEQQQQKVKAWIRLSRSNHPSIQLANTHLLR
ncbi:hypothetical protein FF1_017637 [Malus domestica]